MESSKLINYLTNKCQSDHDSMVMEHVPNPFTISLVQFKENRK
jgi:hypothetical protein